VSDVSTQTDLRPDLSHGDTDDIVFHYVDKSKIVESAVTGDLVTALCGEIFPVTRVPKPGSPVCARCKELMDMLRSMQS
jgi:hypothetical protein